MRELLLTKLELLGYDKHLISQRLNSWEFYNDEMYKIQLKDIQLYLFDKPSADIARYYFNFDNSIKDFFIFEGNIDLEKRENPLIGEMAIVNYELDKDLCMICVTKADDIKVLKYIPNVDGKRLYINKKYEDVFSKERDELIESYYQALIATNRLSQFKAKEILKILASEYIIDKMILENLNPKIKLYEDAKDYAKNITNYIYKYINKEKILIETIKKEIIVRVAGNNVKIGKISNEPYLFLNEVNQMPNFSLDKPSYVWLLSNHRGIEELAIYTANAIYSSKTYQEWSEEREDIELINKAEEIALNFSRQIEEEISKEDILEILKKLNKELVLSPTKFISNNTDKTVEQIESLTYEYSIITNPDEFEAELYIKLENYLNGRYRHQLVESIYDNYMLIGKKINYIDENENNIIEETEANFNVNNITAVLKKTTIIPFNFLQLILKNDWEFVPIPKMEVIFYYPKKEEQDEKKIINKVEFYRQINKEERKKKMAKVYIKYLSEDGFEIKRREEIPTWIGEEFIPEIQNRIIDENGLVWEYSQTSNHSIIVKENEGNIISLVYYKLVRKVKIQFVDEDGNQIREPQEFIKQVGEIINYEQEIEYTDRYGTHWEIATLDKINQKVLEEEEKNVVNVLYREKLAQKIISFYDEQGIKIMADKIEEMHVGEKASYSLEEIIDDDGKYWFGIETKEEKDEEKMKVSIKCKPVMTNVNVVYINSEGKEILPSIHEDVQAGMMYIPKMSRTWIDEQNRSWIIVSNQIKEIKIKKEEENIVTVKYVPVLVNATIKYQSIEGKDIKPKEEMSKQLGSIWEPEPSSIIKDERGNEWQLVIKDYQPIEIKENEKENVMIYTYQVARASVVVSYQSVNGETLKAEEQIIKQVGGAFVPTPEQILVDKEGRKWRLYKIQPAMLKVKSMDNKVTVMYQAEKTKVVWQFFDVDGYEIKEEEIHMAQIGAKYTPIVENTTIQKGDMKYKLLKIEPYEKIIIENSEENVMKLVFVSISE